MIPAPIHSESIPAKAGQTIYPAPFDAVVAGRSKRKLGDLFHLTNFGVNHTTLAPGAASALFHRHSTQDEFIYILDGTPTLRIGDKEFIMQPGECCGFKAGSGLAHQLVNHSNNNVIYLEVGDRSPDDTVEYPNDDIQLALSSNGVWRVSRKDGTPY